MIVNSLQAVAKKMEKMLGKTSNIKIPQKCEFPSLRVGRGVKGEDIFPKQNGLIHSFSSELQCICLIFSIFDVVLRNFPSSA